MATIIVILTAGVGSRLGRPHPKPLTPLADGRQVEPNGFAHHPVIAVDATDGVAGGNEPR